MVLEQIAEEVSNRPCWEIELVRQRLEELKQVLTAPKKKLKPSLFPEQKTTSSKKKPQLSQPQKKTSSLLSSKNKAFSSEPDQEAFLYDPAHPYFSDSLSSTLDYESLFSYLGKTSSSRTDQEINKEQEPSSTYHIMSDLEAEKTVTKVLLKGLIGDQGDISCEEKENFRNYESCGCNKTRIMLYHRLSPFRNENVDYGKVG